MLVAPTFRVSTNVTDSCYSADRYTRAPECMLFHVKITSCYPCFESEAEEVVGAVVKSESHIKKTIYNFFFFF